MAFVRYRRIADTQVCTALSAFDPKRTWPDSISYGALDQYFCPAECQLPGVGDNLCVLRSGPESFELGQYTFGVTIFFDRTSCGMLVADGGATPAIYSMVMDNRICVEEMPRQTGPSNLNARPLIKAALRAQHATSLSQNALGSPGDLTKRGG